jgi:hypothetical protein
MFDRPQTTNCVWFFNNNKLPWHAVNMHLSMSTRVSRAICVGEVLIRLQISCGYCGLLFYTWTCPPIFWIYHSHFGSKPIMTLLAWTYHRSYAWFCLLTDDPRAPIWLKNWNFETSSGCWLHWIILGFHWRYPKAPSALVRPWQGRTQPSMQYDPCIAQQYPILWRNLVSRNRSTKDPFILTDKTLQKNKLIIV